MCGFVGLIHELGENHLDKVDRALCYIESRGPDSRKLVNIKNITIGFNRLSLQDLTENANQPMKSLDGNGIIAFNGEIYNKNYLKEVLAASFPEIYYKTTSDTEVLLNSLHYLGVENTLKLAEGMFAFVYYNLSENNVYIARDKYGQKPIYYKEVFSGSASKLAFSSEAKSLIPITGKLKISKSKCLGNLFLTSLPQDENIFDQVKTLKPGSYCVVDGYDCCHRKGVQYYDPKDDVNRGDYKLLSSKSVGELVDVFDDLMHQSIQKHSIADAPLGILFSTGVDSNLISTYFRDQNVSLFHCTSKKQNTAHIAEKIAIRNNQDLHLVNCDKIDFAESLVKLSWAYEQSNKIEGIILNKACEQAKNTGHKALMSGCASDELFGGYPNLKSLSNNLFIRKLLDNLPFGDLLSKILKKEWLNISITNHYPVYAPTNPELLLPMLRYSILGRSLDSFDRAIEAYEFLGDKYEKHLSAFLLDELYTRLPRFMIRNDRMSMCSSIELRCLS